MDAFTGHQIGHYRILRQLGAGAFATVYLAEHLYIEKLAAIKVLHVAINAQSYRDFQEEARIIARLEHPHIIRLLDFGFYEQLPYLVMDYATNGTLRTLYPQRSRISPQQVVNYVFQVAEALDYAHQQNVLHRDVKPENILLNSKNELILSDFGIALVQQTQQAMAEQKIVGTPLYMAPEQFRGIALPASDQYAVGVMVYEWLCGEPPFSGNAFALSYQHVQQAPRGLHTRMPNISPAIDDVVAGALAKNPEQRFTCVRDFAVALEAAIFATQPSLRSTALGEQLQGKGRPPGAQTPLAPTIAAHVQEDSEHVTLVERKEQSGPTVTMPSRLAITGATSLEPALRDSQQRAQNQNRQRLIQRVRSFWITGVLEQSLEGAALIKLDLQEMPDAVANPWQQIVPTVAVSRKAETRKSILQLFAESGAELLILGGPGAGKTTVLLTLARDLLDQAEQNEDYPVPVIFNLSTWSHNQPVETWLVDELYSKYQVPQKLGQQLVQAQLILPLLDGLDEAATGERTACIEAINRHRREHGSSPLVVCSRSADYLAQEARLLLSKAVMIQTLSIQQANDYLVQAGDSLKALRVVLQKETALRELTGSPLLLRILALTYYNAPVPDPDELSAASTGQRFQQALERYVERMLARSGDRQGYAPQETRHWLAWLARQLQQHNQKIFYIERLQPDCLEGKQESQRYTRIMVGLIFCLLGIFVLGPTWVNLFIVHPVPKSDSLIRASLALLLLLANCLILGLVNGTLYRRQTEKVSGTPARQKWKRMGQRIGRGIVNTLLIGLFFGLPFAYYFASIPFSNYQQSISIVATLTIGVLSGSLLFLTDWLLDIQSTEIRPAEIVAWSWSKFWRSLIKFLGIGLLCNLLVDALLGFSLYKLGGSILLRLGNSTGIIITGLAVFLFLLVLSFTILFAVIKALTSGLSTTSLAPRDMAIPNQGIRRSARNSLMVGLGGIFFTLVIPVLVAILFKWTLVVSIMLSTLVLSTIPLIVLIMALRAGGIACIQHLVLHWLLWRKGEMPWNYPRFLDYAAEHILLQKVGGGYMFVHRFLLDYFTFEP